MPLPSNRSFGAVFFTFFSLVAAYLWWKDWSGYGWAAGIAVVFGATALLRPSLLTPFNRLWMRFAELLHRIVTPLVLGFMFFVVLTPVGMVMRFARRDALRLRLDPSSQSYWVERQPPGPPAESLRDQF
jgi:hypothetical protein